MRFNILNTEVYISFTFLGILVLMVVDGNAYTYIVALCSSILHELIHVLTILVFRGKIYRISLSIFGGNIYRDDHSLDYFKEAIINLSAPITNLVIGVVSIVLSYDYIGYINIFIGTFNICPFYNFDGGRGLENLLKMKFDLNFCERIIFVTSIVTILGFSVFIFYLVYMGSVSYSLILIIFYLISCICVKIFTDTRKRV